MVTTRACICRWHGVFFTGLTIAWMNNVRSLTTFSKRTYPICGIEPSAAIS